MIPSVFRKKHALGPDPRADTGFAIKIRAKPKRDPWLAWFSLRGLDGGLPFQVLAVQTDKIHRVQH